MNSDGAASTVLIIEVHSAERKREIAGRNIYFRIEARRPAKTAERREAYRPPGPVYRLFVSARSAFYRTSSHRSFPPAVFSTTSIPAAIWENVGGDFPRA